MEFVNARTASDALFTNRLEIVTSAPSNDMPPAPIPISLVPEKRKGPPLIRIERAETSFVVRTSISDPDPRRTASSSAVQDQSIVSANAETTRAPSATAIMSFFIRASPI